MNAPVDRRSSPEAESYLQPGARLRLRPPTFPAGPLDGAWWPRSADLMRELPSLIDLFDTQRGRVSRIVGSRRSWPDAPQLLPVTGHTVKAAWFVSGVDPYRIRLFSYGVGRWDLLVIPASTDPSGAARLMTAATDPHHWLTASALMAAEERHTAAGTEAAYERSSEGRWEGEGGASPRLPPPPNHPSVEGISGDRVGPAHGGGGVAKGGAHAGSEPPA